MKKVISIAHQKGGVGKTTIATNLAVELSKRYKVVVIDLDPQRSMTYFNAVRVSEGLFELNVKTSMNLAELKKAINENNDLLLIDVGGYDSDINRVALLGSNLIITPVSDSCIEIGGLVSFQKILKELKEYKSDIFAHILFNRVHVRTDSGLNKLNDFVIQKPEFKIFDSILKDRKDYKTAFEKGQSVIEYAKKAVKEMNDLIEEVIKNA